MSRFYRVTTVGGDYLDRAIKGECVRMFEGHQVDVKGRKMVFLSDGKGKYPKYGKTHTFCDTREEALVIFTRVLSGEMLLLTKKLKELSSYMVQLHGENDV